MARIISSMAQEEAWSSLSDPWQECLSLAWQAFSIGTIPVGAVLVDEKENVVARARNAVYSGDGRENPDGSLLAHAEVNALWRLDPASRYENFTLYGSLEPCMLCVGAAVTATVGRIRFAGVDPYAGASSFVGRNRAFDRLDFAVEGPLPGLFGRLAAALHVEFYLRRNPNGFIVKAYREAEPAIFTMAEGLHSLKVASMASAGVSLPALLPLLGD
jgi:tRNA(adenine34) deaminase